MSIAWQVAERLVQNVEKVIIGKHKEVELTLLALLCNGHILIEDVPGTGKTTLAKAIAHSLGCTFKRIQFTPDLLPTDATGVSIYNQKTEQFEFRPGPLMAQIVLADEINRATPKTQSALLEAMEERQVSVDGVTHILPSPFIVMATQNPIEYEGTFPLPEAQLDRFLLRLSLGYPSRQNEVELLDRLQRKHPLESLAQVCTPQELVEAQEAVREVYVDGLIKEYIVNLIAATREQDEVYLGASPRGSLALYRASQAHALLQGRNYVIPDDVKALAPVTLPHRIIMSPSARMKGITSTVIVEGLLSQIQVPGSKAGYR
ncbi:MAG: MoxR family ATPase [Chloroflexi bacterium]|jgi:MoxR-like ATPase|nr:MoxR family ATPase [Chloroflexota bacterium]OJV89143.1 MAG: AAA family ATPase [Chloroflexi bacterium 54-19]